MSTAIIPEEPSEQSSPSPQSEQMPPPGTIAFSRRTLISLTAAGAFFAFFLPWVTILGANLSGLDVQKIDSYKYVWAMPLLAVTTLGLNVLGMNTDLIRRVAGLTPFAILGYGLIQSGSDLLKAVSWGGWFALMAGLILICIPNTPQTSLKV